MKKITNAILILIILISLGIIAYLGSNKKTPPAIIQPTVTPTIPTPTPNINISNWKTYQNEQFGYEIKYPNNWNEAETEKSAIHFKSNDINCDIYAENKNNQTLEQWVQKENNRYIKIKDITVDGSLGLIAKDAYTEGSDYSVALFPHKNNTYMMLAGCDSSSTKKLEDILSTFKFIEK